MTVEEQIAHIVDAYEGERFTADPSDLGGPSRWGVTLRTLQAYRRTLRGDPTLVLTAADVETMTRAEAIDIGVSLYATRSGLRFILHDGLRFVALDYAWHAGTRAAICALQRAVGVEVDGIFGPVSQDAVNGHANPVQLGARVLAIRSEALIAQVHAHESQRRLALGWWARITSNARQLAA